jgi:PAS domain-containing protein
VLPSVEQESAEPSVLADFDAGYVLDTLSCGIVVLDKQLCTVYANLIARNLLAINLVSMRGRPLAHLLPQPQRFDHAVRRALEGETTAVYTFTARCGNLGEPARAVGLRIVPLHNQMSRAYVLVELSAVAPSPSQAAVVP